jgi:diguanylate cyclase (GGDEF)-like protein
MRARKQDSGHDPVFDGRTTLAAEAVGLRESRASQAVSRLVRFVLLPLGLAGMVALAVCAAVIWSLAERSDRLHRETQAQMLTETLADFRQIVGQMAVERAQRIAEILSDLDQQTSFDVHEAVEPAGPSRFRHHVAFLVEADGAVVASYPVGETALPATLQSAFGRYLAEADRLADPSNISPVHKDAAPLGDRPAFLAFVPVPGNGSGADGSFNGRTLVTAVRLEPSILGYFEGLTQIAELIPTRDRPSRPAVAVETADGGVAAYLDWADHRPGADFLRAVLPWLAGLALVLAVVAVLVGFLLMRATRDLAASESRAVQLSNLDILTSLPNRRNLLDRLGEALARRPADQQLAVALVDLDGFKDVNEQRGTYVGDRLLAIAAERLSGIVGADAMVARMGADEFAIVACGQGGRDPDLTLVHAAITVLGEPYEIGGRIVQVGASGGVATAPRDGTTREDLTRRADLALRAAKDTGRGCLVEFHRDLERDQNYLRTVARDLRAAMLTGEIEVFYQPIATADTGTLLGFEALVSWNHPMRGYISPADFVPVAEECGLIHPLGEFVLRSACLAARDWPGLFVGVNVSPMQARHHDFLGMVHATLAETGLPADRLVLEITEGVLMESTEEVTAVLSNLRQSGVKVALDDFGTGYSSLAYLQKLPIDKLKIDRSFVKALSGGADAAAIVHCIVNLGRAVGLTVVAEGVETLEEQIFLRSAGCQELQGYKVGKPMPVFQANRLVAGREVVTPQRGYAGALRG